MRRFTGNPFAESAVVSGYEAWYETTDRRADRLEKALLKQLLARFPRVSTILEVGCGTGHFTRWFGEQGVRVMGLDLSRPMLAEAVCLGSPPCVRGDALALPFSTAAFDLVALVTTLEFLPEPVQALGEALRVARQGLVLGVLNRQSLLGRHSKREGGPILDGSELAEQVLPVVSPVARALEAEMTLFQVTSSYVSGSFSGEWYPPLQSTFDAAEQQAKAYLERMACRLKEQGIEASTATEIGAVAQSIIEYAEANRIDLIAMCTHGRTGLARWALGSVADRVLRAAVIPILLVRAS